MKPAPFDYFAPTSLEEASALLAQHGYDAKILAGGQSLVPTMNFRLSQPAVLIDINKIPELSYIRAEADGSLRIGAMTRQSMVERSAEVTRHAPLLHEAMPLIAHRQIRNRGTIGGSLAHADPAAELPVVATTLNARFRIRTPAGHDRWVDAREFYIALFTTDLQPEEILTEVHIPPMPPRTGWAVQEVARRHGDYAIVGAAATVTLDEQGACRDATLVYLSVGEGPVMAEKACGLLRGQHLSDELLHTAAHTAATVDIEPTADIHASVAYRRFLAETLGRRVLATAFQRARA
jgi:carbon-monoxide dehydrogenase medium subunit